MDIEEAIKFCRPLPDYITSRKHSFNLSTILVFGDEDADRLIEVIKFAEEKYKESLDGND